MSSIICHYLEGNLCMHPSAKLPNRQLPCVFKTYDDRISRCKHQQVSTTMESGREEPFDDYIPKMGETAIFNVRNTDGTYADPFGRDGTAESLTIEEASKLTISTEPLEPIWGNETCSKEDCPSFRKCNTCNWNGSV